MLISSSTPMHEVSLLSQAPNDGDPSYSPCLYRPFTARLFCCENQGGSLMTTIGGWADRQNNDRISHRQINGLDMDEHPLRGH